MMGLWADGWFYISSAGLLISGVLFFFLLGQYRLASEAADAHDGDAAEAVSPAPSHDAIRPVYVPEESHAPVQVASHPADPKPESKSDYSGPDRRKENATGGISPAVVYMQNIKSELGDLHKDLRALAKRLDDELAAVSTRDEALIERLTELARAVEGIKVAAAAAPVADAPAAVAAPAPAPEPKKARKEKLPAPHIELAAAPEPAPAPKTEPAPEPKLEPKPEPKVEPKNVMSPDETIRMELGAIIDAQTAKPETKTPVTEPVPEPAAAPAPVAEEPAPEEKPRRGPVWPV